MLQFQLNRKNIDRLKYRKAVAQRINKSFEKRIHRDPLSNSNIDQSKMCGPLNFHLCPKSFKELSVSQATLSNCVSHTNRNRKLSSRISRCKSIARPSAIRPRRDAHLARRQEKRSEIGRSFPRRGEDQPPYDHESRRPLKYDL